MKRIEEAMVCLRKGCSCSQAIMAAYAPTLGLDRDTALKIASGFGGGMGRMAETCGAVTGAFMVLGLKQGWVSGEEVAGREKTYETIREFARRFRQRHGTIVCRELLKCDISTPEGLQDARQRQLFTTVCHKVVADAAEVLEELLGPEKVGQIPNRVSVLGTGPIADATVPMIQGTRQSCSCSTRGSRSQHKSVTGS